MAGCTGELEENQPQLEAEELRQLTSRPFVSTCTLQPSGVEFPSVIELNVGGHFFTTRLSTLSADSSSMLAAMFSGRHAVERDSSGRYFIDRDGSHFTPILNYLRHGELPLVEQARAVYREAQYYQLTGLIEWCERQPNVIAEMMYTRTRQWLGPEYEQLKDRLLGSARERFTRSPGTYLDDKTGFFELTIAFSKKAPARCGSGSPTGSASEASAGQSQQSSKSTSGASKTRTDCTEHKFNSDTHKPDAFLPPALDLETTLNFLQT